VSAGQLDLLADGSAVREQVRGVLASWRPADLTAVQQSAAGYPVGIWEAFCAAMAPHLSDPRALCVAMEEVGAARCPLPVLSGLAAPAAALATLGPAGAAHRASLLAGGRRYAFVLHGQSGLPGPDQISVSAERDERGWQLRGRARNLTYADSAQLLIVPATVGEGAASRILLGLVHCESPALRKITRPTLGCDHLTDLEIYGADLEPAGILADDTVDADDAGCRAREAVVAACAVATLAAAAELVGLSARLLEMTAQRVLSRHAFGGPLAALQGVQLRAADMYLAFAAARESVSEAASRLAEDPPDAGVPGAISGAVSGAVSEAVSEAKVTATQAAVAIAAGAHQLCGGWGLLEEAGVHHYTRAIKALEGQLGSPAFHRKAIAERLRG
jgi:alkylation response protein AidB-like acyl-CoA dehydrogenase